MRNWLFPASDEVRRPELDVKCIGIACTHFHKRSGLVQAVSEGGRGLLIRSVRLFCCHRLLVFVHSHFILIVAIPKARQAKKD